MNSNKRFLFTDSPAAIEDVQYFIDKLSSIDNDDINYVRKVLLLLCAGIDLVNNIIENEKDTNKNLKCIEFIYLVLDKLKICESDSQQEPLWMINSFKESFTKDLSRLINQNFD